MDKNAKTKYILLEHYERYPKLQICDIFKFLFQSSFGCEHMVSSPERAIEYIAKEYEEMTHRSDILIERLDGEYSRVHLSCMDRGISAEELGMLFCRSAKKEPRGREELVEKLEIVKGLVCEGDIPFSADEFQKEVDVWANLGYPAIHHSSIFRKEYHPAYRVIANEYLKKLLL